MIRCSSISDIMTNPQKKSDEWSKTAINSMLIQVREEIFGVRKSLDDVRCIQKGKALEDEGIQLYNDVFFLGLEKVPPEGRRDNGIITGEPDLD